MHEIPWMARGLGALTVLVLAACSDATDPLPGPLDTRQVSVADNVFSPDENVVEPGDTVTWTWLGSNPHNVTFDDSTIGNSATRTDGTFSREFTAPGEYTYYCTIHGRAAMSGRVMVDGG